MASLRRSLAVLTSVAAASSTLVVLTPSPSSAAVGITEVWTRNIGKVVESSPNVVSFAGQNNILVGSHDGKLYRVHPDGSDASGWPINLGDGIDSSPAAADVDSDGTPEIFTGSGTPAVHSGNMWGINANGSIRWKFHGTDAVDDNISMFSSPAVGDVNYDGVPDVSGFSLGLKGWSFNANTGDVNPGWNEFYQDDSVFSSPALADIDGDGVTDYVVGGDSAPGAVVDNRGGVLRAVRGDGSVIWQFLPDDIIRSSPVIADIDGDGEIEIIVGVGDYWVRQPGGANDSSKLYVLNRNGTIQWERNLGAYTLASPALADVNGDGNLDIIEGTWEGDPSQQGKVWAFDGNGNTLPHWNGKASGGGVVIGQVSTADFDNDGGQDVLVPTGGGVFAYSGKTGASLFSLQAGQAGFQNTPWIGDLDADSKLDIVIVGTRPNQTGLMSRYELTSTTGTLGTKGWEQFRGDSRHTGTIYDVPLSQSRCLSNPGHSYLMSASDGGLFAYCGNFKGSMGGTKLNSPVVGMTRLKTGDGYWQVARDGGIFAFGDAQFKGSMGGQHLNSPIVGMASTPSGGGYWLVAADGGIFAYGDAQFKGSMGGQHLNSPIVGMASTPSGGGYWLVAADGGIFAYGDAQFKGSTGSIKLNSPVVGMTANEGGYLLVAADGGIFAYGAQFKGSMGGNKLNKPIVGIAANPNGAGYWLVASDGGIFAYGVPFLGSTGNLRLNSPVVGIG